MREKVVVAMSGGVDSSVCAALLNAAGFEVVGMTLTLFKSGVSCCGGDESSGAARQACEKIGIKHYVKDAVRLFNLAVMENFKKEYLSGRTPNPCVECNRHVKFDYLFRLARSMGADFLATGHYARLKKNAKGETGLYRGRDTLKDQSYFLYPIKKEYLKSILFPLGELTKSETRKIAKEKGLAAYKFGESKDICFAGNSRRRKKIAEKRRGRIVDTSGNLLGYHDGYFNFTVGQRRGLGVSSGKRLYVVRLEPEENKVVLGDMKDACAAGIRIKDVNWLSEKIPGENERVFVQLRYRSRPAESRVEKVSPARAEVRFLKPQFGAAKGQSAVFYKNDRVLGGGIIEEAQ